MTAVPQASNLIRLVQAILTRAREQEGYVTKTKLIKYLYLLDIAAYRRTGRPLTGFTWVFHHYGPWAPEYQGLYQQAERSGAIRITAGSRPDLETEFVETTERVELTDVIEDVRLEIEARRIIDAWADRRLGEMLDFVYFRTEPMDGVERGQRLDFTTVERAPALSPSWEPPKGDRATVERLRRRIAAKSQAERPASLASTPPSYDEEYYRALSILDEEERA